MTPRLLAAIIIVLLTLLTGCATRSYAPTTTAATQELKIKAGDDILVVTTRRQRLSLRVTEVRSDRLVGVTSGRFPFPQVRSDPFPQFAPRPALPKDRRPAGEKVEVPYDELAVLQVSRFDVKAAGLVTVVLAVTVAGAAAAIHGAPLVVPLPGAP